MANKSAIKTIPLAGDLNLSKNKLDTIPIGGSGYLRNDSVLYGNILSPVYKHNTGYDAEYYDKEGNRYNVSSNSLSKNGNSVMSYTNRKLTETKLNVKNLLSYDNGAYVRVVDTTIYFQPGNSETEYEFSFNHSDPDWHIASILTARSIKNVGALIMYIGTNGKYYISFWQSNGEVVKEELPWTEINSPLVTWYKKEEGLYFFSCFSDSGADFQGSTKSYALKNNSGTWTIKAIKFEPRVSQTETVTTSTSYYYKDFLSNRYPSTVFNYNSGTSLPGSDFSTIKQKFTIAFPDNIDWTNPCNIRVDLYFTSTLHYDSYQSGKLNLVYGSTYDDILDVDISNIDTSQVEYWSDVGNDMFVMLPTLYGIGQNGQDFTVAAGSTWLDRALDKNTFDVNVATSPVSYDSSTTITGDPAWYWKKGSVPQMFFMDGNDTDKKAVGFLWAKVSWTSNNVAQEVRFKVLPRTNYKDEDAWNPGWNYIALYDAEDDEPVDADVRDFITSATTATITDTPLVPLNAFLDGGKLICTDLPKNVSDDSHFEKGLFGFTGAIYSAEEGDAIWTVKYNADGSNTFYLGLVEDSKNPYPYKFIARTVSLDKNYFRYMLRTRGFGETTTNEDGTVNEPPETDILFDSNFNKVIINPGYNTNTGTLKSGSVYQKGPFRILYNNNVVSNISYGQNNKIGTLLCDWDIIDEVLDIYEKPQQSDVPDYIVIRDVYGNILKYSWEIVDSAYGEIPPYTVILDRFIVINTTSYYNCYDIKTGQKLHYASDYNNRFLMGIECYDFLKPGTTNNETFNSNDTIQTISGSNQNGNYQITNDPISSYSVAPETLENMWMVTNPFMLKCEEATQAIDIYLGFQNVTATYFTSYKNGAFVRDSALDLAYMSTDTLYNPNIFTKYIQSYTNAVMVLNEGSSTAYSLNRYNGQVFLSYQMLNGLENAKNVFVIQTLCYYISDDYIFEVYYDNGQVSDFQVVANIKNMKYIGCLPSSAIFWSPKDRTFFAFQGDAMLRKVIEANEISTIYGSWYDTSNQYLYLGTNIGLLCLNDVNNFLIKDLGTVTNMWFFDKYMIAKNTYHTIEGDETDDFKLAFIPNEINEDTYYTLESKWLGSSENYKSKVDCIYFRLAKPELNVVPKLTIKTTTMTDLSTESDTKTIEPTFDEATNTAFIRYQPKYQTCVSMKVYIHSNCPLISWSVGYIELPEQAQISSINI